MFLFVLFCLSSPIEAVTLGEEIVYPDKIIAFEQGYFVLDRRQSMVFRVGKQGEVHDEYDACGSGPGEYYKLTGMALSGKRLYLSDLMGKVIVLDTQLNYLAEKKIDHFVRDMLVQDDHFFLVGHLANEARMVTRYDQAFNRLGSFGAPLPDSPTRYLVNDGRIFVFEDKLYFVHMMMLGVQVFSLDGTALGSFYPPHIKDSTQAALLKQRGKDIDLSEIIKKVTGTNNGRLRLTKYNGDLEIWQTWVFDCGGHYWLKPESASDTIVTDGRKDYHLSHTASEQIRLKPYQR